MGNPKRSLFLILVLLFLFALGGCSGGSDSDALVSAGGESSYTPGASVNAVAYNEAADITLFIWDEGQEAFVELSDGEYVDLTEQQTKTLGVKVEGGTKGRGRVFISDGGANQVEAVPDDTGYYVCDFMFGRENLIRPVLIQEIYSDGYASKKKIILRTRPGAKDNELVRDGLGVLVSAGLLDILKGPLGEMLIEQPLDALEPAKESARDKGAVLYIETVLHEDLFGIIPINIPIKADIGIRDGLEGDKIYEDNIEPRMKVDIWWGFLQGIQLMDDPAMDLGLGDLLGGLGGDDEDDMMAMILGSLDLEDTYLFLDLYGMPDMTNDDAAALGAGLYVASDVDTYKDDEGTTHGFFPDGVSVFDPDNLTHESFLYMDPGAMQGNIGVDFSQDNLSRFLGGLLDGQVLPIDNKDILGAIPVAVPDRPDECLQELWISFNRAGLAFDFMASQPLLILDDVSIEYREDGSARWQMSVDINLIFGMGMHKEDVEGEEHSMLDIYLTLIPELSHCHVMRDNLGIGIFDHSAFIETLFAELPAMLGGGASGPLVSLDMSDMDIELSDIWTSSKKGRCFLEMAIDEMDPSGLCFISTAGI